MVLLTPGGRQFQSRAERIGELTEELQRNSAVAASERKRSAEEKQRADAEHRRADAEHKRAEAEAVANLRLAAKLRELGVDPDTL